MRGIDCVHDVRARMGRPIKDQARRSAPLAAVEVPSSSACAKSSLTVGALLEMTFDQTFSSQNAPTTAFSAALRGSMLEQPDVIADEELPPHQTTCGPAVYDALYIKLVVDVLEACKWYYSSLDRNKTRPEDQQSLYARQTFLRTALPHDNTTSMHFSKATDHDVALDVPDSELKILYDVWSAVHPLGVCICFSTLLRPCGAGQAIRHLVILEARQILRQGQMDDAAIVAQTEHAEQCLAKSRLLDVPADGVPEEPSLQALLLICQASLLFAWNHLAHLKSRKGMTYMAVGGKGMGCLQRAFAAAAAASPHRPHQEQGLHSELKVSFEITSSFFFVCTVWAFSQLGRSTGEIGVSDASIFDRTGPPRPHSAVFPAALGTLGNLLLSNHPYVKSSGHDQRVDQEAPVQQLLLLVRHMPFTRQGEDIGQDLSNMLEAIRDVVSLYLLFPLKAELSSPFLSEQDALACASQMLSRLLQMAGSRRMPHAENDHLLSQLAFKRSPSQVGTDLKGPLRSTMAAATWEALSSALSCVADALDAGGDKGRSTEWMTLCGQLMNARLDLVDSTTLGMAKASVPFTYHRLISHANTLPQLPQSLKERSTHGSIFTSESPCTPATSASSVLDAFKADPTDTCDINFASSMNNDETSEDFYNLLWGSLPQPDSLDL